MPNHVSNILKIEGDSKKVSEVLEILKDEEEGITFDKFLPMPEELVGTSAPSRIVSQREYDEAKELLEYKLASGEKVLNTSLPLTREMQKELIEKYGSDNWYDWAYRNWGTKWGAYDGYQLSENSLFFLSAWSTPHKAMINLSTKYPEVIIKIEYADEDFGHNVGNYVLKDGQIIEEYIPKGGSVEAIKMALNITGGEDYYLGDSIYDMLEEDIDDVWYNTLLNVIVEKEIVDENYPKFVQEYLLNESVKNEQYEYASKLKNIIKV